GCFSRFVDGVTGPGPPSKQAALATALLGSALRAACLEGGRSSLTLMVLRSQRDEPRSKHQGETTMNHYAGIDVSLECSSVCVVDASGKILREARVASEPEALIAWFRTEARPRRADNAKGLTNRGPLQKGGQRRISRRAHRSLRRSGGWAREACPPYDSTCAGPEERASRASRRMNGTSGAS